MNSYAPVTGNFISAVWRRIVMVRIAESIAIATAIASAADWYGESPDVRRAFKLLSKPIDN